MIFEEVFNIDPNHVFDFEVFLKKEMNLYLDRDEAIAANPSIAASSEGVCNFFLRGYCAKGNNCPFRHTKDIKPEKSVVCKHWLRGLCKKGDLCEFLHEYNLKKMPECWFFTKYGECSNAECIYLHIDPESKVKNCAWYARGFCKHGPNCRNKHARKAPCKHYLAGFCPKGPECQYGHPKYELPLLTNEKQSSIFIPPSKNQHQQSQHHHTSQQQQQNRHQQQQQQQILTPSHLQVQGFQHQQGTTGGPPGGGGAHQIRPFRSLDEVTCFKCGGKGHFANRCQAGRRFQQSGGEPPQ